MPKSDTVPEPVLPILETPRVLPYRCGTLKLQSQPSSSNRGNQNKHQKKPSALRDSGSSSQNSEKKKSDLDDKIRKDGKLTVTEQACRFANNLCLFCGGVGHTAKECPKFSSSALKVKGHAAKGKSNKSETPPAEDSKKWSAAFQTPHGPWAALILTVQ